MKTIAVINRKGGVAKTATAQALGAGLKKRGFSVVYVDLDSQTNLTYALGADTDARGAMELLTESCSTFDALQQTPQGYVIAGSEALAGADAIIDGKGKEYRLKNALEVLRGKYAYVIIDTPAALGTLTINALTAADTIVIPVQADEYSLQGIGQLYKAITAVKQRSNPNLKIDGILITRYNARTILSRDMQSNLQDIARHLGTRLYSTPIRECISVKEAQSLRQDIFSYAPKSNAAKDYDAFVMELINGFMQK